MEMHRPQVENHTLLTTLFSPEVYHLERKTWMENNWMFSVYGVFLYLVVIYGGQEWMKNRKPFDLKKVLFIWNLGLASFSITGSLLMFPDLIKELFSPGGVHRSFCGPIQVSQLSLFCLWLFTLSKIIELGDTLFIILRKRPLMFLHWYHHVTVLLYCWIGWRDQISTAPWFAFINYMVHSVMYLYFCVTALGIKVPRGIAKSITLIQLSQMIFGLGINSYAYFSKSNGLSCDVPYSHIHYAYLMYFSYFVLFGHFFYKVYVTKSKKKVT